MTKNDLLANIRFNYKDLGLDMAGVEYVINDGEKRGFSYEQIYTGIRMVIAEKFGKQELFSVEEVAWILDITTEEAAAMMENSDEVIQGKSYKCIAFNI